MRKEDLMSFNEELKTRSDEIEEILNEYLPKESGYQKPVLSAMNYSVRSGGKRIRPMLMMETYHVFGGKTDVVNPFMAAIEMIHTYSLIHDDLPAMDNDEYRRGRKTAHIVYGEDVAILAGDGLLNFAFETALKAFDIEPDNHGIPQALKVLASKAGVFGMTGGQTIDVTHGGKDISKKLLDVMYEWKTSALIESSMMIGAILAGAPKSKVRLMERIASNIGKAFQIQDDILDVTGNPELLGKPVGSDVKNHKTTYVTIHGLDESRKEIIRLTDDAVKNLHTVSFRDSFLEQLLLWLARREN